MLVVDLLQFVLLL